MIAKYTHKLKTRSIYTHTHTPHNPFLICATHKPTYTHLTLYTRPTYKYKPVISYVWRVRCMWLWLPPPRRCRFDKQFSNKAIERLFVFRVRLQCDNTRAMANLRQVPLTCSGHTRPVVHLDFSDITDCGYFLISACKGTHFFTQGGPEHLDPIASSLPSLNAFDPLSYRRKYY